MVVVRSDSFQCVVKVDGHKFEPVVASLDASCGRMDARCEVNWVNAPYLLCIASTWVASCHVAVVVVVVVDAVAVVVAAAVVVVAVVGLSLAVVGDQA